MQERTISIYDDDDDDDDDDVACSGRCAYMLGLSVKLCYICPENLMKID